jgi:hypothetical protein
MSMADLRWRNSLNRNRPRESPKVTETFPLKLAGDNFPLAMDKDHHRLFVGCRKKPKIVVLDSQSGKEITAIDIPGDLDDEHKLVDDQQAFFGFIVKRVEQMVKM